MKKSRAIYDLSELNNGDFVVHNNYGIGIYRGIDTLTIQGKTGDYLTIEYDKGEKLFIPCENINLIHKYIGMDENEPKLNSLSNNNWRRTKARARKMVDALASELVELYAKRMKAEGISFPEDDEMQRELEDSFPFNETEDQLTAINSVKEDMISNKPMDRLVCGDVGYGKTEVAVRAAFKAICGGKQVAVLVPTTILAMQHYNTFSSRFSTFPVKVELLSRFRSKKEQKEVIENIKNGISDVVIGTHRLLQRDVVFKDLGLLIVDEEQRFGVKHKEKIKSLRESIDILTLTATPIPRTLYLSLTGARDMSIINTPPADRLPVKTIVGRYDEETIRKAIKHELARDGQIYYVHNRVKSIDLIATKLKKLVPEAKIRTAHGQMDEKSLEKIMLDFYEKSFNILVSTTIIENGLDIPSVNTIIIERADTFGLSQLYQLRGRVGRSKRQAFAYFFYPEDRVLTKIAKKRLQTIKECSELGSGYRIAMRDLEIRGAGNLLGYKQHGQIHQVGFEMYCKLLKEAVETLKEDKILEYEIELDLKIDASIPSSYISDGEQKIGFYQKMAAIKDEREIDEISEEMIDRFGPLPQRVKLLLEIAKLRGLCYKLRILSLKEEKEHIIVKFRDDAIIEPERITLLLQFYHNSVKFVPGNNTLLYIKKNFYRGSNLISLIKGIMDILSGKMDEVD
jgi:transcription-repair coupling factor (superfamily II helicase)